MSKSGISIAARFVVTLANEPVRRKTKTHIRYTVVFTPVYGTSGKHPTGSQLTRATNHPTLRVQRLLSTWYTVFFL